MLALYTGKGVAPEVNLRECISHTPLPKCNYGWPLWLWNPEGTPPEVQNWDVSGPTNVHTYPTKIILKKSLLSITTSRDIKMHNFLMIQSILELHGGLSKFILEHMTFAGVSLQVSQDYTRKSWTDCPCVQYRISSEVARVLTRNWIYNL